MHLSLLRPVRRQSHLWAAWTTALALAGCGSAVQFDRALGTGRYGALPTTAPIAMAGRVAELPQPAIVLGELRLKPTRFSSPQGAAEEQLLDSAARYGCDAVAEVREERVETAGRKATAGEDDPRDFQWVGKCVRTPAADDAASVASAARDDRAKAAEAERVRRDSERAAAAEKERAAKAVAAEAERERKKRDAEAEKARKESEEAERDRKRLEGEADKARKQAEAADQERRKKEAELEKARKSAEEKARKFAETTGKVSAKKAAEVAEKTKKEAAAKTKKDAELAEKIKKDAELAEKSKKDAEAAEKAKREADAKKDAEAKKDADAKSRRDADQAEKSRKDSESSADAEKAKQQAESEAKAKKEADAAERRRADEAERTRKEAEARRDAEDKAQADAAKKKGKGGQVDWAGRFDAAAKDDSESAWLDYLGQAPDGQDIDKGFERLQKAVKGRPQAWLSTEAPQVSSDEVDFASPLDAAQVRRDLQEADATMARFLLPREFGVAWTLRNPTKHPVVVDLRVGAVRQSRLLEGGATATGVWKGACVPQSSPLRSKVGLVLQYRFACDTAKSMPRLGLVRPARRELSIDRRGLDADPSLEAIAKIWSSYPSTRLVDVQLQAIDEAMRRRSEDTASVVGKVVATEKVAADKPQPVKVEWRNNSNRDVTVVFDVGTGREERLLVGRKGTAEIRYELPPGVSPDLKVRGVLPKLRSADWLVGNWAFQGVHLVILPLDKGFVAFAIDPTGGEDLPPRIHMLKVELSAADVELSALLPGWFAVAMFADKAPAACDNQCTVSLRAKLAEQDQYIVGAGRVLAVEMQVPGRSGTFKLSADN